MVCAIYAQNKHCELQNSQLVHSNIVKLYYKSRVLLRQNPVTVLS